MFLLRAAGYLGFAEECSIGDCPDTEFYRANVYRHVGVQNGISWAIWLRTNASTYHGPTPDTHDTYDACTRDAFEPAVQSCYLRGDGPQDFTIEFRTSEPPYDLIELEEVSLMFVDLGAINPIHTCT